MTWVERWVTPTTLLTAFGGVVWGIQLNFAVLHHASQLAQINTEMIAHEQDSKKYIAVIERSTVILDNIERRLHNLENK